MKSGGPKNKLADDLYQEMQAWPIFDAHSHIDPHRPTSRHFDEILGYHYYTELAHSAGMPAELVSPTLSKNERVRNLFKYLDRLDNTVQYEWLSEITQTFLGHEGPLDLASVDAVLAQADHSHDGQAWDEKVWETTKLEAVFLTNEFDDPLEGWNRTRYVPCLRTDDLVLKLHEPATVERLKKASKMDVVDEKSFRMAVAAIFAHFVRCGARACAISLPNDFVPRPATPKRAAYSLRRALHGLDLNSDDREEVRTCVFWMLAEFCAEFRLPFDLMIGPTRNSYPAGVAGGRDLFDRRVSLAAYHSLFNHFPNVTFPVSTLSPDAAPELVAHAWIFPNVVPNGHWWYSNIPTYIEQDLRARVQAVPKTKQIGYYSDAYKLEFILPKFNMYRRILAEVLADEVARKAGWTETSALEFARLVLIENPKRIFPAVGGV